MSTSYTGPAGWAFPTTAARKAHFFPKDEIRSLCGRYGRWGVLVTPDDGTSGPLDCAPCRRKFEASQESSR